MDDLSGVNWAPAKPQGPSNQGNYYPSLRPTPPISGRSTPQNIVNPGATQGATGINSKGSTPGNDSFANLVSFSGSQPNKNISLQEQQRAIQDKKLREEEERKQQFDRHFSQPFSGSLSTKASASSTPKVATSPFASPFLPPPSQQTSLAYGQSTGSSISSHNAGPARKQNEEKEEDILAAFNSSAPVDASSHMPPVSVNNTGSLAATNGLQTYNSSLTEDDDPFGLGMAPATTKPSTAQPLGDDDDVLGDLSKPVSEFPKPQPQVETVAVPSVTSSPEDAALAELVDMGFPPEKARRALKSTESGTDVQAAVGWLLNQAHEDSRKDKQRQTQGRRDSLNASNNRRSASRRKSSGGSGTKLAWMKEQGKSSAPAARHDGRAPAKGEKDPSQVAQELGNNLFKTANSLWKTGTKKLNQAMADFNTDADPSQPKWMREVNGTVSEQSPARKGRASDAQDHDRMRQEEGRPRPGHASVPKVTDEALLLEAGSGRPQQKPASRPRPAPSDAYPADRKERISPSSSTQSSSSRVQQSQRDPRAKLSRQAVEEEAAQAYISPARRRKPAAKPVVEEADLLDGAGPAPKAVAAQSTIPSRPRPTPASSLPPRPPPPTRNVPSVSPTSIAQSHLHRQTGTAAFKRGDYASATTSYSTALSYLPATHPLTLPLLTNRALSHFKTGDPKATLQDSKTALDLIGPSRGVSETVDFGVEEGKKGMDTYWGKAMQRQAEAHESLERYADAAASWRACVEAGVGGATSITGRNRCENALRPKPKPTPSNTPSARKVPVRPKVSALSDLSGSNAAPGQSAEAVTRLRAANLAAERADDEKFALGDAVDARVKAWRNGKEGNLRALLSSLENVLWADAGWKKVGMGEVIQPNRVKVVYMKGIAKVHPDKLPTTATTEQKMISAAVFATLNEAWERFKTENGL